MTPNSAAPDTALPPHPAMLAARATGTQSAAPFGRIQSLDLVRGAAIVGVVGYHFSWDLNLFGLFSTDVTAHPVWVGFARSLAGTFMVLVGVNLVLAHGAGIRWQAFCRRLLVVAAAAAIISVATYAVFPESFIYFGILHAIAASSVLGLAFLHAPRPLLLVAAVLVFLAPQYVRFDGLSTRWLSWTGLASWSPSSVDFVPIFPWFALPLIGILVARLTLGSPWAVRLFRANGNWPGSRALAWAGRHSLAIYLLHQPVLLGTLYSLIMLLTP